MYKEFNTIPNLAPWSDWTSSYNRKKANSSSGDRDWQLAGKEQTSPTSKTNSSLTWPSMANSIPCFLQQTSTSEN